MSALDLIIFVCLGYAAVRGYMKGIIMEIANLVGIILGLIASIHFSHFVGGYLRDIFLWNSDYVKPVAFVITFIVILLLIQILARLLDKTFKKIGLGIFVRMAGIIVGMAKMLLIIGALLFALLYVNTHTQNQLFSDSFLKESLLAGPIQNIVEIVLPLNKI